MATDARKWYFAAEMDREQRYNWTFQCALAETAPGTGIRCLRQSRGLSSDSWIICRGEHGICMKNSAA